MRIAAYDFLKLDAVLQILKEGVDDALFRHFDQMPLGNRIPAGLFYDHGIIVDDIDGEVATEHTGRILFYKMRFEMRKCFQLLKIIFNKAPDITTLSLPFLAIYDAGAALCRSIGKTNVTMNVSIAANVINVIGNCVGVFVWKLGAAGVAWPSLISRVFSAVAVTAYCFRKQNFVRYRLADILAWDGALLKKVMGIALPNGVENGVHQLVKVALSSMVALFGTYQIAANGVAQSIWALSSVMGFALAPVYTTVIGQCMGARDIDAANFYFRKLNRITLSIAARLLFAAVFGLWLGWGVIGVAIGMSIDIVFRGAIFIWRLRSQKWTQFRLI